MCWGVSLIVAVVDVLWCLWDGLLIVAVVNCWHVVVHWNVLLIVAVVDVFCVCGVFC